MQRVREFTLTTFGRAIASRPWLFIAPVIIAMSTLLSYSSEVDLFRSSAIVTFDYGNESLADPRGGQAAFEQTKTRLVRSLLIGDPLRSIVRKVWPGTDAKIDPLRFNQHMQHLRGPGGIELEFKRESPQALTVGYTSRDPHEAFDVVKATVDTLLSLNEEDTKKRIETSVSFLTKERESQKDKLSELEQQILKLRSGLPDSILRKYDQEQVLRQTFPSLIGSSSEGTSLRNDEILSELKLTLSVLQKEYDRLNESLEAKPESLSADPELFVNVDNDPTLERYSKLIGEKEQLLNAMIFKGLREAHPQRKSLQAEIDSIKALREKRIEELASTPNTATSEVIQQKRAQKIRLKMDEKKQQIDTLNDKIHLLEAVQEESRKDQGNFDDRLNALSQQTAKLAQLESEKALAIDSYNQITKRLQSSEREGRVEEENIGLKIHVVEPPRIPKSPLPLAHVPLLLMGFCLSAAGGVALALLAESLDSTVYTAKELQKIVSTPILGAIDAMVTRDEIRARSMKRKLIFGALFAYALLSKPICHFLFGYAQSF